MDLLPHDGQFKPGQLVNVRYVTTRGLANYTGAAKVIEVTPAAVMLATSARSFWIASDGLYSVNGADRRRISKPGLALQVFTVKP